MKGKQFFIGIIVVIVIAASSGILTGFFFQNLGYNRKFKCEIEKCSQAVEICRSAACVSSADMILKFMNRSVDPCDDFYEFMCGRFAEHYPVNENNSNWHIFGLLQRQIFHRLKEIFEEEIKNNDFNFVKMVKRAYLDCMNEDKIDFEEDKSLKKIKQTLEKLGGWPLLSGNKWIPPNKTFSAYIASEIPFVNGIVELDMKEDYLNNSIHKLSINQPSKLGRKAKFNQFPDKIGQNTVSPYERFIQEIIEILGNSNATKTEIKQLMQLEDELEEIALHPRQKQNPIREGYYKMTIRELNDMFNHTIDWLQIFSAFNENVTLDEVVIVDALKYFQKLPIILSRHNERTLYNYIIWNEMMPIFLSMPSIAKLQSIFLKETEDKDIPTKWEYCVQTVKSNMIYAVSRMYIDRFVDRGIKNFTEDLIYQYVRIYENIIKESSWMGIKSKDEALKKAKKISVAIDLPDWIFDDEQLEMSYNDSLKNILQASKSSEDQLDEKSNDIKYSISLAYYLLMVNAYYSLSGNEIQMTFAILAEPFLYPNSLMALNFGAFGSIIGHEIGHAFDNIGRYYDHKGELRLWWDLESLKNYDLKKDCFIEQYNRFCPAGWKNQKRQCIDGKNTVGENIADNLGVKASVLAYEAWAKKNGKEKRLPGLEKYSPEQLLFMSFGHIYCENLSDKASYSRFAIQYHSPHKYRFKGVIENSEEFHKTFRCSKNKIESNCKIW